MVGFYQRYFKRPFDIAASSAALLLLFPILALTALAIRLEDGGRVIFRQRRVGRGGRIFTLLKFRSMPENVGDVPSAVAGRLEITRVGRFIRRTNLDELPQLVNILRGDMSVVGPRPALPSQQRLVDLRTATGAVACAPGLTGLAQIRAYTGMSEDEKAACDAEYASDITLWRDALIIARTVSYLFRPPPVY
jgi:lipopolysaccharide/colanic/teichoic acid biosynthesis glycosyltransferase